MSDGRGQIALGRLWHSTSSDAEIVCDEQSVPQAMHVDSQHSGTQPMADLHRQPPDEAFSPSFRLMSTDGETRLSRELPSCCVCAQLSLDSWPRTSGECRNGIKSSPNLARRRTPRDGTGAATQRLLLASSRVSASQWDCKDGADLLGRGRGGSSTNRHQHPMVALLICEPEHWPGRGRKVALEQRVPALQVVPAEHEPKIRGPRPEIESDECCKRMVNPTRTWILIHWRMAGPDSTPELRRTLSGLTRKLQKGFEHGAKMQHRHRARWQLLSMSRKETDVGHWGRYV